MSKLKEIRSFLAEGLRQLVEKPLYTLGIGAYAGAVRLAALRNDKASKMVEGHRRVFDDLRRSVDSYREPVVWVHAASLGEFEQGRPLIERIRAARPDHKIVLSFFSPSGYEVRKNYAGADAVVYLPFDLPANVRKFLDAVRPSVAIFIKYEFWRNYLHELARRNVPTYLVSAVFRPDQAFFRRRSAWYRNWLRLYTHIFVQDERSRRLLADAGVSQVTVAGDTRFDRVTDICRSRRHLPVVEAFASGDGPVFIAGSSWPTDEAVYADWLRRHPEVKAIIAPHEFDARRLERLSAMLPESLLMSKCEADPQRARDARLLIIDSFGCLSSAYSYADIAYVGGGFGAGLHNICEAAVYGIPVIYGPNNSKFIEAGELARAGGGFPVSDANEFARVADTLLNPAHRDAAGNAAADYISSKLGASDIVMSEIF